MSSRTRLWLVMGLVATAVVGLAWWPASVEAQGPAPGKASSKNPRGKGRTLTPAERKKAIPNAADPLAPANKEQAPNAGREDSNGSVHFKFRLHAFDDAELSAVYYPARIDTTSPVVLLIHEKDRSSKDFEDPIPDLKNRGFAEYLQENGYAVLAIDLRGHGANLRRTIADREWQGMMIDLQAAFQFLVDRHNRGELNLAKLGVVALGEGANLAAAWAYAPGGAVTSEGRVTDISALALISPLAEGSGLTLAAAMNALAPRIPVQLVTGERDNVSHDAVKRVRGGVEKIRQNKVELFPSALHGYKLLRLEPRAATVVAKFLDANIKFRAVEWEPRYNLNPVTLSDVQLVRRVRAADKEKEKEKAREEPREKAKEEPREKAKEEPREKAKEPEEAKP